MYNFMTQDFQCFGREMSKEEFERKVHENPNNNHLLKQNRKDDIDVENKEQVLEKNVEEVIIDKNEIIEKDNLIIPKIKSEKRVSKITDYNIHPEISYLERNQYKINDDDLGIGSLKEKFQRNIEAIKVLKKCEEENRYATKEEQEILVKYVGWGGLSKAFEEKDGNWSTEYNILKDLLTETEYKDARASTLTAFYTPPIVIRSIYKALENMGIKEANILEPSCRNRKLYWYATRNYEKL